VHGEEGVGGGVEDRQDQKNTCRSRGQKGEKVGEIENFEERG